jgi:hypothetical protein
MADQIPGALSQANNSAWRFQQTYIERLMDHAALSSAHPDDTLILAGPPRFASSANAVAEFFTTKLLPMGMVQQMQVTQQKPTTPMQAIGSGRSFFVSGKAQGSASIARLFVNGRNLLRALYTNAVTAGIDVRTFDDPAAYSQAKTPPKFFANLDSELFLIPFGMAMIFRDKIHNEIGAFYLELCQVNTWAVSVGAGQTMIMENVNMMFDRLLPIDTHGLGQETKTGYPYDPQDPNDSDLFKAIFSGSATANPPGPAGDNVPNYI